MDKPEDKFVSCHPTPLRRAPKNRYSKEILPGPALRTLHFQGLSVFIIRSVLFRCRKHIFQRPFPIHHLWHRVVRIQLTISAKHGELQPAKFLLIWHFFHDLQLALFCLVDSEVLSDWIFKSMALYLLLEESQEALAYALIKHFNSLF